MTAESSNACRTIFFAQVKNATPERLSEVHKIMEQALTSQDPKTSVVMPDDVTVTSFTIPPDLSPADLGCWTGSYLTLQDLTSLAMNVAVRASMSSELDIAMDVDAYATATDHQRQEALKKAALYVKDKRPVADIHNQKVEQLKADGWTFGAVEDPLLKITPMLLEWKDIGATARTFEKAFAAFVRGLSFMLVKPARVTAAPVIMGLNKDGSFHTQMVPLALIQPGQHIKTDSTDSVVQVTEPPYVNYLTSIVDYAVTGKFVPASTLRDVLQVTGEPEPVVEAPASLSDELLETKSGFSCTHEGGEQAAPEAVDQDPQKIYDAAPCSSEPSGDASPAYVDQ